jgi:hypothetical protein
VPHQVLVEYEGSVDTAGIPGKFRILG